VKRDEGLLTSWAERLIDEIRGLLPTLESEGERGSLLLQLSTAQKTVGKAAAARRTLAEGVAAIRRFPGDARAPRAFQLFQTVFLVQPFGDAALTRSLLAEAKTAVLATKPAAAQAEGLSHYIDLLLWCKEIAAVAPLLARLKRLVPAGPKGAATVLRAEAGLLTAQKRYPEALATAKRIADPTDQSFVLVGIAMNARKQGAPPAVARQALAAAVAANATIKNPNERASFAGPILEGMVQAGDGAGAKALAKKLATSDEARSRLAQALADADDLAGAQATSKTPSPALVQALARAGKIDDAQRLREAALKARSFTMQDEGIRMLGGIAAAQAKAGDADGLDKTIALARDEAAADQTFGDRRAVLLNAFLEALLTAGRRYP
jgi:hypothetical protein